jgi:hypothetical protein
MAETCSRLTRSDDETAALEIFIAGKITVVLPFHSHEGW